MEEKEKKKYVLIGLRSRRRSLVESIGWSWRRSLRVQIRKENPRITFYTF